MIRCGISSSRHMYIDHSRDLCITVQSILPQLVISTTAQLFNKAHAHFCSDTWMLCLHMFPQLAVMS